jgi:hypothetical protein
MIEDSLLNKSSFFSDLFSFVYVCSFYHHIRILLSSSLIEKMKNVFIQMKNEKEKQ